MKFAICNEFCQDWDIARVFQLAAETGYDGVELAPFTLAPDVNDISAGERREIVAAAAANGVEIVGLHWLLVSPEGLYINHPNADVRTRTQAYLRALIRCCGELGGTKMVIGSPKQRNVMPELTFEQAWDYARETFASILPEAEQYGVDLCIEPLGRADTNYINTAADGIRLCRELDHPRFRLHLDAKAMTDERRALGTIIRESAGFVGHFHANDANRGYPGSGDTDFAPIVQALKDIGYDEWISVEVFDFSPGPETIARASREYLHKTFGG